MMLTARIISTIGSHPEGFASSDLMTLLREEFHFPESSSFTIVSRLVREGRIRKEGHLLYPASGFKPIFHIIPDEKVRNLYKGLKVALPFTQISIWQTDAILPLMHDIPNIRLTLVGTERLAVGSVSDALENLTDSLILQDSEKSLLSRLAPGRELVVVTPQVSQAPVEVADGVTVPTLEKLLVDILCDNALHALTGSEAYSIYATAYSRYAISQKTLLRYAGRRNRTEEVNAILNEIKP
ncbi:MAG: hypothetical protein IJ222_06770 [Bacteroidales bacterium]|nr:hypothetical protein [Bacteroidales bacterium]